MLLNTAALLMRNWTSRTQLLCMLVTPLSISRLSLLATAVTSPPAVPLLHSSDGFAFNTLRHWSGNSQQLVNKIELLPTTLLHAVEGHLPLSSAISVKYSQSTWFSWYHKQQQNTLCLVFCTILCNLVVLCCYWNNKLTYLHRKSCCFLLQFYLPFVHRHASPWLYSLTTPLCLPSSECI